MSIDHRHVYHYHRHLHLHHGRHQGEQGKTVAVAMMGWINPLDLKLNHQEESEEEVVVDLIQEDRQEGLQVIIPQKKEEKQKFLTLRNLQVCNLQMKMRTQLI